MIAKIRREFHIFLIAISFLTTLPVPSIPFVPDGFGKSGRWFTVVGTLIGGLVFAFNRLLIARADDWVVAILTVTLWAWLTGGLHLDGFADCCDGLLASVSAEKRLIIMKDPTVGTFAAVGLILLLALKIALVHTLLSTNSSSPIPILTATIVARWLILPVALQSPAREGGMGSSFSKALTWDVLLIAALLPMGLLFWSNGIVPIIAAHLVVLTRRLDFPNGCAERFQVRNETGQPFCIFRVICADLTAHVCDIKLVTAKPGEQLERRCFYKV